MTKTQLALEHRSIRYERTCHQFLLGGFGGGPKSSQGRTGEIRCLDSSLPDSEIGFWGVVVVVDFVCDVFVVLIFFFEIYSSSSSSISIHYTFI